MKDEYGMQKKHWGDARGDGATFRMSVAMGAGATAPRSVPATMRAHIEMFDHLRKTLSIYE